jgi:tetratricopeptide (TPR) repeat protein
MSCGRLGLVTSSLVCAVVIVTAPPRSARADATTEARQTFKRAEKQYAAAKFDGALVLYQKAYELKPLPGFHFNIGQCYRKLGQYDKALEHYRQYLERSKRPRSAWRRRIWDRNRADVKQLIQICEQELASQAALPAPVEDPPHLDEKPPPVRAPAPPPPRSRLSPTLFWTGVGVTGALVLTSVITGSVALSQSSEYKDPDTSKADRLDLRDSGRALRTTSTVTIVLAAAAAAGTAVLYIFTDFGAKESSVAAAPLQGGGVLMMEGRF